MLQIMDEGPWTLQNKGGVVQCNPKRIVVTSNFCMEEWYDYVAIRGKFEALRRRIDYLFDVREQPANVHYFTDEWTAQQSISSPYDGPEINWDDPIELETSDTSSQASTYDMNDAAHALTTPGGYFIDDEAEEENDGEEDVSDYGQWEREEVAKGRKLLGYTNADEEELSDWSTAFEKSCKERAKRRRLLKNDVVDLSQ